MYVARVPNRGSPPGILLRESYREGGQVKTRTLANLSRWPAHKVQRLERALKGQPARLEPSEAFDITRSLPHGHVAAVLGSARALGVEELIDPAPSRNRDLVARPRTRRPAVLRSRARVYKRPAPERVGAVSVRISCKTCQQDCPPRPTATCGDISRGTAPASHRRSSPAAKARGTGTATASVTSTDCPDCSSSR